MNEIVAEKFFDNLKRVNLNEKQLKTAQRFVSKIVQEKQRLNGPGYYNYWHNVLRGEADVLELSDKIDEAVEDDAPEQFKMRMRAASKVLAGIAAARDYGEPSRADLNAKFDEAIDILRSMYAGVKDEFPYISALYR